jgi:ribosome biogenesis protein BMS1
MEDGEEK